MNFPYIVLVQGFLLSQVGPRPRATVNTVTPSKTESGITTSPWSSLNNLLFSLRYVWRMTPTKRMAVVTGSNKGIGFAIVRGLCKQFDGDVYLTARDEGRGRKAVEDLKKEGLNPLFHHLDISDHTSIQNLKAFLQKQYGGLDILFNNAAIIDKTDAFIYIHGTVQNFLEKFLSASEVTRLRIVVLSLKEKPLMKGIYAELQGT